MLLKGSIGAKVFKNCLPPFIYDLCWGVDQRIPRDLETIVLKEIDNKPGLGPISADWRLLIAKT